MTAAGTMGACAKCGEHGYVMPLHDERGGPLFCFMCAGAWHAEHAPRRRLRRVLIKALKAYEAAGGSLFGVDFDELKFAATSLPVPFAVQAADTGDDFSDLTSELLAATIALTHPDKHPLERKAEANRVTQELHALKPFVFPAPAPEPPPAPPEPGDDLFDTSIDELNKASPPAFPCEDCRDAIPMDYCDQCKAQHDRKLQEASEREEKERARKNARQRERYEVRREHWLAIQRPVACATCGEQFEPKRSDAKYCSHACRQRAYVKRDGKVSNSKPLGPNDIERAIEAALTANPDNAFTTDDLCERVYAGLKRPERKHRAGVIPVAKKVCERLGENWDWWRSDGRGGTLLFWNRASLMSYAMRRLKSNRWNRYRLRRDGANEDDLKAMLRPGGEWHESVVEGGEWWEFWQEDVAEFRRETASRNATGGDSTSRHAETVP